jgi:predicted metal-dependent hydrolase
VVAPGQPPEVVLPRWAGRDVPDRLLAEHRRWFESKVAWATEIAERPSELGLDRPGVVWVGGTAIPVCRVGSGARFAAVRRNGTLELRGPSADGHLGAASAVERWYRREARAVIGGLVEAEAGRLRAEPGRVSIRNPRSRWASCSSQGTLSFSWRLILAPLPVTETVVVHELVHLRIPGHGPRFRRAMDRARPGWLGDDRWLVRHEYELHRYDPGVAVLGPR